MGHGLTLRPCAGRRRTCLAAAVGRRRSQGRRDARILQSRRHTWRAPRRHTRGAGARCLCIKKLRRVTVWAAGQSISANRPRLAEAGRGWPGLAEAGRGWPGLAGAGGRPESGLALAGRVKAGGRVGRSLWATAFHTARCSSRASSQGACAAARPAAAAR